MKYTKDPTYAGKWGRCKYLDERAAAKAAILSAAGVPLVWDPMYAGLWEFELVDSHTVVSHRYSRFINR